MKRKIYRNMCLMALLAMVLGTLFTVWLMCRDMQEQMKSAVVTEVRYLESAMEVSGEDYLNHLSSRGDGNSVNRITWVGQDGAVLYDSFADNESLPNHGDRPEIVKAFSTGRGESTRLSDTLAEQTYYYASRLSDGSVIRVASTTRSGIATVMHTIPWMVCMAIGIFVVTMIVADILTKRIVEPINRLNPDAPDAEKVYDELSPLVRKLEKQQEIIGTQMETLREKQEEFTAITENMQEGFIVADSTGEVISYNTSALKILTTEDVQRLQELQKLKNGSVSGNLVRVNILSLNRSESFRKVVDAAIVGERGEEILHLGGRVFQIIANPVEESKGKHGAVVVILDVTEQHNREELRREFTANVSHELKTPLTSISGYAEIMKNGLVASADMKRFSQKIYEEAQRLITLVGDIIRLSQLDEGKIQGEKVPVDLYQVTKNVADRLRDMAEKAGITLTVEGSTQTVSGSERILDEMIYNLCDNAIKYNKKGGSVTVRVDKNGNQPTLMVQDTGIGIPAQDRERIFERFYRVDKSHSNKIGGTGLGLSIVKHGAVYHNARVSLTSEQKKGTTITIVFDAP